MEKEYDVTIEELKEAFPQVDSIKRILIFMLINNEIESELLEEFESNAQWIRQCYNRPNDFELRLNAINELLEGFGTENITFEDAWIDTYWRDAIAVYINMGESYTATILYDTNERVFQVTTYGGFVENYQNHSEK